MTLKVAVLIYAFRYNQSKYYEPSFTSPDFVSSLPDDHGTSKCSDIDRCYQNNKECNASFGNNYAGNNSQCVNWNKYYGTCQPDGPNPFYDTTSFDNIGIAWIATFQVNNVLYYCQGSLFALSSKQWVVLWDDYKSFRYTPRFWYKLIRYNLFCRVDNSSTYLA